MEKRESEEHFEADIYVNISKSQFKKFRAGLNSNKRGKLRVTDLEKLKADQPQGFVR